MSDADDRVIPSAEVRRMSGPEIAGGWIHGYGTVPVTPDHVVTPRAALEAVLLPLLVRGRCFIAFSGGRDSSALLAVAVGLARRTGLPMPIPLTLQYPGVNGTDERDWQETVLKHLGVDEWDVITTVDEHDSVGPIATRVIAQHGVIWPPNFTPTWRMLDRARGGSLVTGENGDEIFGIKRVTPLTNTLKAIKGRRLPDRRLYPLTVRALAPQRYRRHLALKNPLTRFWLRPAIEAIMAERDAADAAAYSLHAGRHARQFTARRAASLCYDTFRALGQEIDVDYVQPFSEPGYVAALARKMGFFGWSGRNQAMARLFGDVLPREVLFRQSKAAFNNAVFSEHTRAFAREWDGRGVDTDLVDPEALRTTWLSDFPHAMTMALLQQAWLASQPAKSQPTELP